MKVTEFQSLVYESCKLIPRGKVSTYASIAKNIGRPKAVRAVGSALRKNPFAPTVPCHRVVASDRKLGGFQGGKDESTLSKKRNLLIEEGVEFEDGESKVCETCVV